MTAVRLYLLALAAIGVALAIAAAALGDLFAVGAFLTGATPPFLLWRALRSIDLFCARIDVDAHAQHD